MENSTVASALEGKVVVLTGGGDGIGRECALAYARAKATVAILDVNLTQPGALPKNSAVWA